MHDSVEVRQSKRRADSRFRRLNLELLEQRRLLAFDASLVADLPSDGPRELTAVDGVLYFQLPDGGGFGTDQLWKTNGTVAGTSRVLNAAYGFSVRAGGGMASFNGDLIFTMVMTSSAKMVMERKLRSWSNLRMSDS